MRRPVYYYVICFRLLESILEPIKCFAKIVHIPYTYMIDKKEKVKIENGNFFVPSQSG